MLENIQNISTEYGKTFFIFVLRRGLVTFTNDLNFLTSVTSFYHKIKMKISKRFFFIIIHFNT